MTEPLVELSPGTIWVTCARDVNESVSRERHIIAQGYVTTYCGSSATTPDVWRRNSTKPMCRTCVSRYTGKEEKPMPAAKKTAPVRKPKPAAPSKPRISLPADELRSILDELDGIRDAAQGVGHLDQGVIKMQIGDVRFNAVYVSPEWSLEFE